MAILNKASNLPISKEQYINAIPIFIEQYKRLPFMQEDEIEVIIEDKIKPYKSLKYTKEFFGDISRCTDYLFEQGIISFKIISDKTGLDIKQVENILTGNLKDIDKHNRRLIHIFLGEDLYCPKKGKYKKIKCSNENKLGGQPYWVDVISVGKGKKKTKKK